MRSIQPPSRLTLVREARVPFEWLWMRLRLARIRKAAPIGGGEPVIVAPGFAADDSWTESLRGFLESIGYQAFGWGLGRNNGRVPQLIPALIDRTAAVCGKTGFKVRLVGWSLGGYLAREVAREQPELVDRVITLGAPVVGGPKYTASAPWYRKHGFDLDEIEGQVDEREQKPIQVSVHALYSRSDGVVSWRACIDDRNPNVKHHRVRTSHLGLIASIESFSKIAQLLV